MEKTLKSIREKSNLRQYEAAKLLGITNDYLSMLENEKRIPSNKLITKMATVYNVAPEDIFLIINRTICTKTT